MASKRLESHLEVHGIVKVCLSMSRETFGTSLEGHGIVTVCLSMASEKLESHLESHNVGKVYACPRLTRHWKPVPRALML